VAKQKVVTEKTVDIEVNDQKIQVVVKKPSNKIASEAQRRGALMWNRCIQDGIMTKKELEKFMKERGIWDDTKEDEKKALVDNITGLEKQLYLGKGRVKISKAKGLAIEMRRKRIELRDLLSERIEFEQNTAESLSENVKFDYIVAHCTYDVQGNRVYGSMDDYETRSDDPIAFGAAQALAEMMFSMDDDFEKRLPENKFLTKFNFVNEDLSLVNKDGHTVDTEGRLIDKEGQYRDKDDNRTDREGNPLHEDGTYIIQSTYLDDDGKIVHKPENVKLPKDEGDSHADKDDTKTKEKDETDS
jgi:hypothetical protein